MEDNAKLKELLIKALAEKGEYSTLASIISKDQEAEEKRSFTKLIEPISGFADILTQNAQGVFMEELRSQVTSESSDTAQKMAAKYDEDKAALLASVEETIKSNTSTTKEELFAALTEKEDALKQSSAKLIAQLVTEQVARLEPILAESARLTEDEIQDITDNAALAVESQMSLLISAYLEESSVTVEQIENFAEEVQKLIPDWTTQTINWSQIKGVPPLGGGGFTQKAIIQLIEQYGSGVTDGNKTDITVSGDTWTLNDDTVGQDELATTGTPDGTKFLRDDLQWTSIPGGGDMLKSAYDTNNDGIVDEAAVITSQGALATLDTVSTTEIDNTAVTFAKMQDIATNRILGRSTVGTGSPEALADADARTIMGLATTDSPQFAAVNIGHATDTTVGRTSAGRINVEGTEVVLAGDNVSDLTNDAGYLTSYTETDPVVGAVNGLVKANGAGTISAAVADTDYLTPGTAASTYQPLDSELTAISGLTSAADRGIYFTGAGTASLFTLTSAARSILDDTSTANIRTTLGVGTGQTPTFTGALLSGQTASTIASFDASKNIVSLATATYPSLTELSYVKGVTSAVQTQINTKAATASPTFTGVLTYPQATATPVSLGNLGATETIDFSAGHEQYGTLDSNVTITHSNEVSGRTVTLYLAYDGTAQRTITWSGVDKWLDGNNGSAPATPSASGNELVVTLKYIGTTCYASATGNYAVY